MNAFLNKNKMSKIKKGHGKCAFIRFVREVSLRQFYRLLSSINTDGEGHELP